MRTLIVTEKPSVARAFVVALTKGYSLKFEKKKGRTRYNPIFESKIEKGEINFKIEGKKFIAKASSVIVISSVLGHILNYEYAEPFDKKSDWKKADPIDLIELTAEFIPIQEKLAKQIEELGAKTDVLCIGTDNDGHGESIGSEINLLAQKKNPHIHVGRMRFTATRPFALKKAFEEQTKLDQLWIAQVDSLRRQDLRMGASLTRFLTVGVQKRGLKSLISYGPCQSSTLWIIAYRYLEKMNFEPQKFWELVALVPYKDDQGKTEQCEFKWTEGRVFDENKINEVFERIKSAKKGTVVKIEENTKPILRPKPLDTDTLESEGARFFRVSPKNIADLAEKLYNNGFITYPRTESSFYLEKDLLPLVKEFKDHSEYGKITAKVISIGNTASPSKGKFSKDHEPIRPAKSAEKNEIITAIKGNQWQKELAWRIYNYIVLRFMATVHKDGQLATRTMEIDVKGEHFVAHGKSIVEKGFLDIYPFRKVQESTLPPLVLNQETPLSVSKVEGWTQPPSLWTEASIIREMARQGIGTDATRSTHLATVNTRGFVTVEGRNRSLVPTKLGLAFYEVFTTHSPELIHPAIRGQVEGLTLKIREQKVLPTDVDFEVINILKQGFKKLKNARGEIFTTLAESGLERGKNAEDGSFGTCPSCKTALEVIVGKKQKRFLGCKNPDCKTTFPLPQKGKLQPLEESCPLCGMIPMRVGGGTKVWTFCPSCWINKAPKKDTLFFCSSCKEKTCGYSSIHAKRDILGELGDCPQCGGKVLLRLEGTRTRVLCQACEKEWKAPNLRRGTKITIERKCRRCGLHALQITRARKSNYFMCPICGEFCFKCKYRCFE